MFFLPLPWVLAEVLIFTTWIHFFDFWNVFFAYLLPSLLGVLMLARSGQGLMMVMRSSVVPGQMPGNALLHQGARLVGALCLVVPLFLTRVLAVFLIVPGLRHLSIAFFKAFIYKKLAKSGGFSFVQFGGAGVADGRTSGWQSTSGDTGWPQARQERDARVVDIVPLKVTHGRVPVDVVKSGSPSSSNESTSSEDPFKDEPSKD